MVGISELEWVRVKTTLPVQPFPPITSRSAIKTERLVLRPLTQADLEAVHELRLQPEVMVWTVQGRPDKTMEETQKNLDKKLAPNDDKNYDWAICIAETGQLVGIGGCMRIDGDLGWPVIGYMLRKECWGKGYGTEFVKGFLRAWWELPRREAEVLVDKHTAVAAQADVGADGDANAKHGAGTETATATEAVVPECLIAVTVEDNPASQNVLRKSGLTLVKKWVEEDLANPNNEIMLRGYAAFKPVN